jgi:hypothetical protein
MNLGLTSQDSTKYSWLVNTNESNIWLTFIWQSGVVESWTVSGESAVEGRTRCQDLAVTWKSIKIQSRFHTWHKIQDYLSFSSLCHTLSCQETYLTLPLASWPAGQVKGTPGFTGFDITSSWRSEVSKELKIKKPLTWKCKWKSTWILILPGS